VDVTIPVSSGDAPASGSGPLIARLPCAANDCGGVYPLRVQLSSNTNGTRTQLFTYLVYANPPPATQKVRVACVLPLALPSGDLLASAPPSRDVDALASLISTVGSHAGVPLTLAPEPATLSVLSGSSKPRARSALSALQALSGAPTRPVLAGGYVPVDAAGLLSAGLGGEVDAQTRRAAQVLAGLRPSTKTWLATGPVDQASATGLLGLGFTRLVVPPADVQGGNNASLTPSTPFALAVGRGTDVPVAESDLQLAADLSSGSGAAGALAGYRTLADLALVYYEQPNLQSARGVVVVPAPGTIVDPAALDTVVGALASDPLVSAVTLDDLFGQVPPAPGTARRATSPPGSGGIPARQIRTVRGRLAAFSSATGASGQGVFRALEDRLLVAEDDTLRPAQQAEAAAGAGLALDQQLATISVRADTVKLTSTAAKVPITVLKQSGYAVTGTLQVSGDKVVFPGGSAQDPGPVCRSVRVHSSAGRSTFSCLATIAQATNAVYVDMRARATGDFRLTVTLTSPQGGLVLATSHVTVRSMSSSLVAVGLSVAAVVVLLTWWGRTAWRRRAPKRGAHRRSAGPRSKEPAHAKEPAG
jgi:hypothetical protein